MALYADSGLGVGPRDGAPDGPWGHSSSFHSHPGSSAVEIQVLVLDLVIPMGVAVNADKALVKAVDVIWANGQLTSAHRYLPAEQLRCWASIQVSSRLPVEYSANQQNYISAEKRNL